MAECPVTVVADDGEVLAVLLEPGAPFTFQEHPFGPHPWRAQAAWGGTTVLQLHREGDAYAVWKFFDEHGFRCWYLNFEAPVVRHPARSTPTTMVWTWSSTPTVDASGRTSSTSRSW